MARPNLTQIAAAKREAENGVDYSPRLGALCPWCGHKTKITRTTPWDDNIRVRYHRCHHRGCVLEKLKISVKSIEVDMSEVQQLVEGRA